MGYANWEKPLLLPLKITFKRSGQQATRWQIGYTWGLRWYIPGKDKGVTFKIKLKMETTTHSIGPNPVLVEQRSPSQLAPKPQWPSAATHTSLNPSNDTSTNRTPITALPSHHPGTGDRLLNLVQGAYLALNLTEPGKTQDCWLCLVSGPPYYKGVAVLGNYSNQTSAPLSYTSIPQQRLTLSEVSGKGLCIGTTPKTHQALCNSTQEVFIGSHYLAAPMGLIGHAILV